MCKINRMPGFLSLLIIVTGCASSDISSIIQEPEVRLTKVQVTKLTFDRQSITLGFDVSNPNAFPLPVESVRYHLRFDGAEFASGETVGDFDVPARSDGSFAITVDMDMLASTAQLSSLVRTGLSETVRYELFGKLDLDIAFAPTIDFSSKGVIAMDGGL